jgi:two-component system phosphate regulon sensor histidine kinase PhoR
MRLKAEMLRWLAALLGTSAIVAMAILLAESAQSAPRAPVMIAAYSLGAGMILLLGTAFIRRRTWRQPLRRLGEAAARLGRGEWNIRVQPHGAPPVRQMAGNLNLLAAQAQKQLADLQQQRGRLQTLVDTLPDPILAVDVRGRVTLLNAPAARLLSILPEQALQQKLVSVVNDEQIVELYEDLLAGGTPSDAAPPLHREIRLARNGQRSAYQAVATRAIGGGALLVLRDVSTLAGAVQMKTDFVANASHELRTPIAAIKIAFETLREVYREDPVQSARCISVIDGHLRRLEEMLLDLLDLSRVENPDLEPHVALVKPAELFANLRSTLGSVARQKDVELILGDDDPTTPLEFQTDTRVLNLVLKNLVENSIKFTSAGGKVTVTLHQAAPDSGGAVTLTVADTGIGIAPEHIDRVFERFYQVDSARSGSAGRGTGLGLAIVKHAVHALGGTVRLESTVGVGTTVICELPQSTGGATEQIHSAVA